MAKSRKKAGKKSDQNPAEVLEQTETMEEGEPEVIVEPEVIAEPEPELPNEIDVAKDEARKNWDLYLRERADLENFRKRSQRDKEDALRYGNDRLLKEMIPVLDNLERAVDHAGQNANDDQGLLEGVNMTIIQFRKALDDFGVKPITAIGEAFDPNRHQAMGQIETAEQVPNTVVTEFQKGYMLHDRLLRPSMVMVAKAPAEESTNQNSEESEGHAE